MKNAYMSKNWSSMIKPINLEVDRDSLKPNYGKFVAKPLERGYGLTLGNSLRRVLLSSLQGAGVIAIKIEGVEHEFGTINNIKEEVAEIILNLKELRFKLVDKEEVTLIIEKDKEGPVTGADIADNAYATVTNPEHVICNISSGGVFKMELKVTRGKGYVTALDNKENFELPLGWIYLDTLFSPISRVNYAVTNARVGKRTDYDKLTLEVWTNAGVDPVDSVALSAKILRDQLMVFMNFEDQDKPVERVTLSTTKSATTAASATPAVSTNPLGEALLKSVSELELSVRSANCLQNANIKYIYELVSKSEGEMLRTKNFGRKSLNEIKELLTQMGLGLGMKVDSIIQQARNNE